jgi:hypothetical protein
VGKKLKYELADEGGGVEVRRGEGKKVERRRGREREAKQRESAKGNGRRTVRKRVKSW